MMICIGRKSTPRPKLVKSNTGMSSTSNSSELNLLYNQKMPFWKKKRFLFSVILMSCTVSVLGLLTLFAVDNIYNQGKSMNEIYNLYNTSWYKIFGNSDKSLEHQDEIFTAAMKQRIKRYETNLVEIHEQEISVTCKLNNGIKELNNEVKRLYESLIRLDARVNRKKRGSNQRTAVVDCVQMNGHFKKILDELNQISETLSSVDDNGICRCKCPSDRLNGTAAAAVAPRVTDLPFDLTTFNLDNTDEQPTRRANEKTKQFKQILVSRYNPQDGVGDADNADNTFKSDSNEETVNATTNGENESTATILLSSTPGNTTTTVPERTVMTAETKEDMFPAMSNAVTNYYDFKNDTGTAKPLLQLSRNEIVITDDYENAQSTSETPNSSTSAVTDSYRTAETTELNYDEISTETEGRSDNQVISRSTTVYENISKSTTEILDFDTKYTDDIRNHVTENAFEPTSGSEHISESTVETTSAGEKTTDDYFTGRIAELTSEKNNVLTSTARTTWDSDKYKNNTDVTKRTSLRELTSENENTLESTTTTSVSDENTNGTNKDRSSSGNQDKNDFNGDRSTIGKNNNVGNENNFKQYDYGKQSTPRPEITQQQQQQQQVKWYPICFNPAPCPPNVMNYRQNAQDTSKNTVQYSAQSLGTYKKKSPTADATIVQNNYPIITYCPAGMVCPMTDVAGQTNTLHCMWKSAVSETPAANVNKNNEKMSNQTTKNNYDRTQNSAVTTKAKTERENDEILTGDLDCPLNTFPCVDNSGCVDTENWCDGRIHCNDASDESQCVCKERIDKDKLCDGYYDCPSGEDELGCFGCNNETFSCGDWDTVSQRSSCFERKTRCDYIKNCPNGRDEDECTLLSKNLENPNQMFFVSFTTGYLHHNWKGKWYPMCGDHPIETWAEKACTVELGEKSRPNRIQYVNEMITYGGPYISVDGTNRSTVLDSCKHRGILVECEPEICGTRSDFKFNKIVDPDRLRRSPYAEYSGNVTSRYSRSKDPRVVGGVASNPGAWPWLIALYQDGIFHCGGVILSDQWVLTAAHCVNQYQKHFYEVQAGVLRRFSFSPMEQSRIVTHVMIHTQYSRTTMENDLAVLRLERHLEFNRWIRPVCLPDNKLNWIPFPGTICTAVGWGATVEHGPDPDNMREVEVPILAECTHQTDIDGKEICAGYLSGGHDTCQGDSGGPLLCREPNNLNKWYVAGIVSHGEGCARPMEPGVYTRVSLYMDWIVKVTDDNGLPQDRPQQYCPGIRCKTFGKQCIPKKRQCDKYVDCMYAEDEQNCDYTGSKYHVSFYRSRNTDRSGLKHKLKSASAPQDGRPSANVAATAPRAPRPTAAVYRNAVNATASPKSAAGTSTAPAEVEAKHDDKHVVPLNETVLHAIRQLFDNQFAEETFSCRRITQVVLRNHRCDGTVDCEDGTDEEACDCRTRLANMYGTRAVCDGVVDCHDGSDETECGDAPKCKRDETVCGWPRKCVKKTAWCDGVVDCGGGDGRDEKYCTALTDGMTNVVLDNTGRPTLRRSGVVTVNKRGVWRVRCVNESTATQIAYETCSALHFLDSKHYEKKTSWNSNLPLNKNRLKYTDMCQGLYVECGTRNAVDMKPYHWHADIVVDGRLEQTGVLIQNSWVLVKRNGLNIHKSYATAVLGGSAYSSVWIQSPYEQIVRVDWIEEIPDTDLDLLHLAGPANVSRGVTPLDVPPFQPAIGANDTCYAIGYSNDDRGNKTEIAILRPDVERCDDGNVCFTVSQKPQSCSKGKNMSGAPAVVCESNFGLFVAAPATVQYDMNFCNSNARVRLPATTEDLMNKIASIIEKKVKSSPAPVCDGKRCQLGECVPWEKVCDGIPNCRDEQDETFKMCQMRSNKCKTNDTLCICDVGSFRCSNGKCVEKSAFCNGINDCGDETDEPKSCQMNTCVEYLRLTAPERLCDGRWDCLDKTDEEYNKCPGYCNRTNVYQCQSSDKCISSELVCDGEADCPESDDENKCIGLITPARNKYIKNEGVLAIRSYGNWHAQCITEDYTNVDYHSLCKGLGFKHAVGIRKVDSAKVDFENFTVVQLNNITDVAVRSATKHILQHTDRTCTTVYVVCSSS